MVQTVNRCHVPLLKNVKTFAFWGNITKGITVIKNEDTLIFFAICIYQYDDYQCKI